MNANELIADRLSALRYALTHRPSREEITQSLAALLIYAMVALTIGFGGGFFRPTRLDTPVWLKTILPFTMVLIPSLIEEVIYRCVLLPHPERPWSKTATRIAVAVSLSAYVLSHPIYALVVPELAIDFLDPPFLAIVLCLGVCCTWTYFRTGSVWVPTAIHWLTVLIWVFFLDGRNPVLHWLG